MGGIEFVGLFGFVEFVGYVGFIGLLSALRYQNAPKMVSERFGMDVTDWAHSDAIFLVNCQIPLPFFEADSQRPKQLQ